MCVCVCVCVCSFAFHTIKHTDITDAANKAVLPDEVSKEVLGAMCTHCILLMKSIYLMRSAKRSEVSRFPVSTELVLSSTVSTLLPGNDIHDNDNNDNGDDNDIDNSIDTSNVIDVAAVAVVIIIIVMVTKW